MDGKRFRRRNVIVDRKFQFGVSFRVIGYVYLYLVLFAVVANLQALRTVLGGTTDELAWITAVERLEIFVEVFVLPMVFTFLCMCLHGLLFTHRLAGPIVRFRRVLQSIRERKLPSEVEIRDEDYFQDLCREVDGMVQHLRSDVQQFQASSAELARASEELLADGGLPPDARGKLLGIANGFSRLRQLVDGYTLEGKNPPEASPRDSRSAEPVEVSS